MTNPCPRCGEPIGEHPARSRVDNTTPICTLCGTREALADAERTPLPPVTQPIPETPVSAPVVDAVRRATAGQAES